MLKVLLKDGANGGHAAKITNHDALRVTVVENDLPHIMTRNRKRLFSEVLGSTGASSGIVNMNVDGTTDQEFYIQSIIPPVDPSPGEDHYDIYITSIIFIVADSAVVHNKFGNVTALTTGIDVIVTESGEETYLLKEIKTGGQLIAHAGAMHSFGDGALVNELTNWTDTDDAQVVMMPISDFVPGGIRLGHTSRDRISLWVRDDLQGLEEFTCRCFGYRLYD